ncbi:MAG TPA: sialidase family protein, partial [Bacteroidota bacterium]|nr:sialidase family protein [Bacteroidota bacterium]
MNRGKTLLPGMILFACLMVVHGLAPDHSLNETRVWPSTGDANNPRARDEMEFLIQRDPVANAIPPDIHRREQQFAKRIPALEQVALQKGTGLRSLVWSERGPNNVGGRTRVLAADVANIGTLIAGAVAGGIWKSTNDGASWRLVLAPQQIHTTSCIAQDVRPGKTHIWYVGTGEFRGSTTNNTRWGAFYRGDGIYKSTDNGETWALLPSTTSGTPQTTDAFDYVWNVATNPVNLTQDEVYAATWNGIYRSTNGGATWTLVQWADSAAALTAGYATDVVVTSTGVVYAYTKQNGSPRVWRSEDGVTWTDIKPSNFPTST